MSKLKRKIDVRLLKDAEDYFLAQNEKVQKKFLKIFERAELGMRGEWLEKLKNTDGIFEFRHRDHQKFYRIFAFWDSEDETTLILGSHGFDKKSNKTPAKEIKKAEQIKKEYFKYKSKKK
jgi:phage-related protein